MKKLILTPAASATLVRSAVAQQPAVAVGE